MLSFLLSITGTITENKTNQGYPVRQKTVRANIKDVASVAGVSTQTVSRVINERPDVSPETRKRVKDVIEQVGYRPSALARSLINQRSYTLGVVIAGLKYIGPSSALSGIASAAEEAGYSLLLNELPRFDADQIEPIFEALLSRHVDGIIWAVSEVGENRNWINNSQFNLEIPLVYLTMEPQKDLTVVSINNYLGGRLAITHLLEQGYRNIGHISGPLEWWEARQRMKAWKDVLNEAGMTVEDRHCIAGNWSSASGAMAVEKLFNQYPEMDAVFVANDQMALSVMQVINQKGLRIPEDIGVVGFDNIPESAYFWPSLTTVQQDQYRVAKVAVEEMIKIIESGRNGSSPIEPRSILLEPTVVVRRSSSRLEHINNKGGG
jgi:DNA-binding LacI/PurR family transcriptional regulator